MKKIRKIIYTFLLLLILTGCNSIAVNEIYNKSYNVPEISIASIEELVTEVTENASKAVVGINKYKKSFLQQERLEFTGSGVIYECQARLKDGTIISNCEETLDSENQLDAYIYKVVTNRHVIADEDGTVDKTKTRTIVKVYLGDEDIKIEADVIEYDDKVDLAVLTFEHYSYIQPLRFADSEQIKRGNFVIALGNPAGPEYHGSATFGIISSSKLRYIDDDISWTTGYIQHDASINSGNSGGALLNLAGELIGINTLKLASSEIDNIYEGMGFAIPSNMVRSIVKVLETGKRPVRRTLGILTINIKHILNAEDYNIDPSEYSVPEGVKFGLYVTEVSSPSLAAGKLLAGDIIVGLNGEDIDYVYQFRDLLNSIEDNDVTVNVNRGGTLVNVIIDLE